MLDAPVRLSSTKTRSGECGHQRILVLKRFWMIATRGETATELATAYT